MRYKDVKWDCANWVWCSEKKKTVNQYIEFRHEFELTKVPSDMRLLISSESNFTSWINGQFVGAGQFTDYPDSKTYSDIRIDPVLLKGRNSLTVLVHYLGIDHFSHINTDGGLIFLIHFDGEIAVSSGTATRYRVSPTYSHDQMPRITVQMGFVFEYNAVKEDSWRELDYNQDQEWHTPVLQDRQKPQPRPLPMLEIKKRPPHRIVAQGFSLSAGNENLTIAQSMQADFLSARRDCEIFSDVKFPDELLARSVTIPERNLIKNGVYLIIDLGREECGFIDLELSAPVGTVVDIAMGEHLEDLRVRAAINNRNFASRYICRQGKQRFTHYANRYAGRYVQLHIGPTDGDVTLKYAGIIPSEYPLKMRGSFTCPDNLVNNIYDTSRRTLHLCMHEHYEDCPWREQALYANDSRNQAIAGYYAFGEYDFPRVSWDLLGKGLKDDGYLEMCAPAKIDITIPSFTMTWFLALDDYLLFSGDVNFACQYLPQVRRMLADYLHSFKEGLLPSPKGERFWHFYDWADGLKGDGGVLAANGSDSADDRFDAPLNLFLVLALRAGAKIARVCGNHSLSDKYGWQAESLSEAINSKFWSNSTRAYQTYMGKQTINNHFAELTQALALLANVCPTDRANELRSRLIDDNSSLIKTTFGQSFYKFEALLKDGDNHSAYVFNRISSDWGKMLYSGATSFWETAKGQLDFNYAGSLCHGWSATPAYFYQAYLLGIRPLTNGFAEFSVSPMTNVVDCAKGKVPTPHGEIEIKWWKEGKKIMGELRHPSAIKPILSNDSEKMEWRIIC
ncbi:family 78 glycoside hydrolase catalytic domain [bacterium]|nr:family 78 glycoside hydrolase catalytic domain [bacterium]